MTSEKPVRAARGLGSTGREVGVLHGVGGLVQCAQPLASAPRASCSIGPRVFTWERRPTERHQDPEQEPEEDRGVHAADMGGSRADAPGEYPRSSAVLARLAVAEPRSCPLRGHSHPPGSLDQHTTASRTTKSIRFPAEQATEAVPLGRAPTLRDGSAPVDAPDVPGVPAGCRGRRSARRTPLSPGCIRGQRPRTRCGPARRPPCAPAPRR